MAQYQVPSMRHTIGGVEYEFRCDYRLHALMTEILLSQPERVKTEYDDDGQVKGHRLLLSGENIYDCLVAAGEGAQPGTDWRKVSDSCDGSEPVAFMAKLFGLIPRAGMTGDGLDEDPDDPKAEIPMG